MKYRIRVPDRRGQSARTLRSYAVRWGGGPIASTKAGKCRLLYCCHNKNLSDGVLFHSTTTSLMLIWLVRTTWYNHDNFLYHQRQKKVRQVCSTYDKTMIPAVTKNKVPQQLCSSRGTHIIPCKNGIVLVPARTHGTCGIDKYQENKYLAKQ